MLHKSIDSFLCKIEQLGIRALAATMSDKCDAPDELKAKIYTDLVLPNVRLLAEFCTCVALSDAEDERESLTDNTGCDV